jgi:integrase
MVLWAKAVPRAFRLHDTRHTMATLLLAAGVDLYAVARILRHTDPKVTFETYAHLVAGYLHAQIDRLHLGQEQKFAASVLHEGSGAEPALSEEAKKGLP